MALPYHLYVIATQVPNMPLAPQFATALILMLIVLSMTVVASVVRSVFRRRREW